MEIITGQQCGDIYTWSYGKVVSIVKGAHKDGVTQVAWSPEGLISGGCDCFIVVWPRTGKYISSFPIKKLDLMDIGLTNRPWTTRNLIPKSICLGEGGKLLVGLSSAQVLEILPSRKWVCLESGPGEAMKAVCDQCCKVLLNGHHRRSDSDSLRAIGVVPSWGVSEVGTLVESEGRVLSNRVVTCGPDHTLRLWDADRRIQSRVASLEGIQPGGFIFPLTPTCIDMCPNGRLVAVGFKDGLWGLWLESATEEGVQADGIRVSTDGLHDEGHGDSSDRVFKSWKRVFLTDGTRRAEIRTRVNKLRQDLKRASNVQADPYRAVFMDSAQKIKDHIHELEDECRLLADYTVKGHASCIRFSPQGGLIAVASRGGDLEVFSIKGLQAKSTQGRWYCTWGVDLREADGTPVVFDLSTDFFDDSQEFGLRGRVKRVGSCKGHGGGVAKVDWSATGKLIRSSTEGHEILIWEAPEGSKLSRAHEAKDVTWATNSVIFGWDRQGIWPLGSSGGEVVCLDVSEVASIRDEGTTERASRLVTGDTAGHLKLFKYPCAGAATFKSYVGHGGTVSDVRFSSDGTRAFSVGGRDCCLFQWQHIAKFPDLQLTPENNEDLRAMSYFPPRVLCQIRRRALLADVPALVKLLIFDDFKKIEDDYEEFAGRLMGEICTLLSMSSKRLEVISLTQGAPPGCGVVCVVLFKCRDLHERIGDEKDSMLKRTEEASKAGQGGSTAHGLALTLIETVLGRGLQAGKGKVSSLPLLRKASTAEFEIEQKSAAAWDGILPFERKLSSHLSRASSADRKSRPASPYGRLRSPAPRSPDRSLSPLRKSSPRPGSRSPSGARSRSPVRRTDSPIQALSVVGLDHKAALRPPPVRLIPLHVFGYNGARGNGNVKALAAGGIIYDAGAHIIVLDPKSRDMQVFTGHTDDVACFAVHPDGVRVASGDSGFEPTVLVWDSTNLLTLGEIRPFDYSNDGNAWGETKCSGPIEALGIRTASNLHEYSAFSITVHDASQARIVEGRFLRVGTDNNHEVVQVVKIAHANSLIVRRGCLGSLAKYHPNGSKVLCLVARRTHLQQGGISALAFTRHDNGQCLISVGQDDDRTILIHNWSTGQLIAKGSGGGSHVLAVEAHPEEFSCVTCGVGHISFLTMTGSKLTSLRPVFGSLGRNQMFTCAAFCQVDFDGYGGEAFGEGACPGGYVCLTGTADGFIYMWEGRFLRKVIPYAHRGPMTCIEVRGEFCDSILTGGSDGAVRLWDLTDESAYPQKMDVREHLIYEYIPRPGVSVRSVCQSGHDQWVFGLSNNQILSFWVTEKSSLPLPRMANANMERRVACTERRKGIVDKGKLTLLAMGHQGSILSVASNPIRSLAASSSDDGAVIIWQLDAGDGDVCTRMCKSPVWRDPGGRFAGALSFSPDGDNLCCGLSDGALVLLSVDKMEQIICVDGRGRGGVLAMSFSPSHVETKESALLAVITADGCIEARSVRNGLSVLGSTKALGLSSVATLDWSKDGTTLSVGGGFKPPSSCVLSLDKSMGTILLTTPDKAVIMSSDWATWRSPFGRDSGAATSEDGDPRGISCAVRTGQGLLACGDDFGRISLFKYPCLPGAEARRFAGHASTVSSIAISPPGEWESGLLTGGAGDGCVVLWAVVDVPEVVEGERAWLRPLMERLVTRTALKTKVVESPDEAGLQEELLEVPSEYLSSLVCPSLLVSPSSHKEVSSWPPDVVRAYTEERLGEDSLPDETLELDHVYGIRVHDTLGNLACTKGGELVYFAAKVAVSEQMQSSQGKRQMIYQNHQVEISCVAVHPTEAYAATGEDGDKPSIHIWNTYAHPSTGGLGGSSSVSFNQLTALISDGISCMSFAGNYLIAVGKDADSTVLVFEWRKGTLLARAVGEEGFAAPIVSVSSEWDRGIGGLSIVTVGSKHVKFWRLHSASKLVGKLGRFLTLPGVWQIFTCACYVKSGVGNSTALTGAEDGSIYIWSGSGKLSSIHASAHQGGVSCLSSFDRIPIFVSGGADGYVCAWRVDIFCGKVAIREVSRQIISDKLIPSGEHACVRGIAIIPNAGDGGSKIGAVSSLGSVLIMSISDEGWLGPPSTRVHGHAGGEASNLLGVCEGGGGGYAASVGVDGRVHVWNMDQRRQAHSFIVHGKVSSFDWCSNAGVLQNHMALCLENGKVHPYIVSDSVAEKFPFNINGGAFGSCARYSSEGSFLAIGRNDGKIDIFEGERYDPLVSLKGGHESRVWQIDWELGGKQLRSNSYDDPREVSFWEVSAGQSKRLKSPALTRDAAWSNERCLVSWALHGLMDEEPRGSSGNEYHRVGSRPLGAVTCAQASMGAAVSKEPPLLVSCGDRDGNVLVFRYPANRGNQLGHCGRGHLGAVVGVCFGGSAEGCRLGRMLASVCGDGDSCVFQWKLTRSEERPSMRQSGPQSTLGEENAGSIVVQGTNIASISLGIDSRLIPEGEAQVRLLQESMARREWEKSFELLEKSSSIFSRTSVKEEWSWKLLKRCDKIQKGCEHDASVLLEEIRSMAKKGELSADGEPAIAKLSKAQILFDIARDASKECMTAQSHRNSHEEEHQKAQTDALIQDCERAILAVTSCLKRAEQLIEDAQGCAKHCRDKLLEAGHLCTTTTTDSPQDILLLSDLQAAIESDIVYFSDNVARAKQQYRDGWAASGVGQLKCETMETIDGVIMRRQFTALKLIICCMELSSEFERREADGKASEWFQDGVAKAQIIREETSEIGKDGTSLLEQQLRERISGLLARLETFHSNDENYAIKLEMFQLKVRDLEENAQVRSLQSSKKRDDARAALSEITALKRSMSEKDKAKFLSLKRRLSDAELALENASENFPSSSAAHTSLARQLSQSSSPYVRQSSAAVAGGHRRGGEFTSLYSSEREVARPRIAPAEDDSELDIEKVADGSGCDGEEYVEEWNSDGCDSDDQKDLILEGKEAEEDQEEQSGGELDNSVEGDLGIKKEAGRTNVVLRSDDDDDDGDGVMSEEEVVD